MADDLDRISMPQQAGRLVDGEVHRPAPPRWRLGAGERVGVAIALEGLVEQHADEAS